MEFDKLFKKIYMKVLNGIKPLLKLFYILTPKHPIFREGKFTTGDRNRDYLYFRNKFRLSPDWLKDHRYYFSQNNRGFGEDAFHAAWFWIFSEYKITKALEIGVYRGQVISLWAIIAKNLGQKILVTGISPLTDVGDSVSEYPSLDYHNDVAKNFEYFEVNTPNLIKEFSTSKNAKAVIEDGSWDLIYIDGSHDYKTVLSDYRSAVKGLRIGGILVMDDSSLHTNFHISFKGHPGPSKVLKADANPVLKPILSVGHNNFFVKKK